MAPLHPSPLGGAQSFVVDLARALAAQGDQVTLVAAEGSEVAGVAVETVVVDPAVGAALARPGGPEPVPVPAMAEAYRRMAAACAGFDAVSQHGFDAEAVIAFAGLPVLHTLHLPPGEGRMAAAVGASGAAFAAVSRAAAAPWAAFARDLRVLANGVPDAPPAGPAERFALFAGRLSPEKGLEHAVAAAAQLGLPLKVAGAPYDPGYVPELGSAEILGPLPRAQVAALMRRASVLLMPARWEEPFGLVAAEAQMAGCPVAAYRRGGLPEVVEEGTGGYLAEPDDIAALAAAAGACLALERAAVQASARARLGIAAAAGRYRAALAEVAA